MIGPSLAELLPGGGGEEAIEAYGTAIAEAMLGREICCAAVMLGNALDCTCWEPIYDLDQATPITNEIPDAMDRPCGDCAYRKNSPERNRSPIHNGDEDHLNRIVVDGEPFWCHDGIRQRLALVHRPTGARIELPRDVAYDPPIITGTPYRANGEPGALCAGWVARRLKQMQLTTTTKEH